jgi:hypothetical protein
MKIKRLDGKLDYTFMMSGVKGSKKGRTTSKVDVLISSIQGDKNQVHFVECLKNCLRKAAVSLAMTPAKVVGMNDDDYENNVKFLEQSRVPLHVATKWACWRRYVRTLRDRLSSGSDAVKSLVDALVPMTDATPRDFDPRSPRLVALASSVELDFKKFTEAFGRDTLVPLIHDGAKAVQLVRSVCTEVLAWADDIDLVDAQDEVGEYVAEVISICGAILQVSKTKVLELDMGLKGDVARLFDEHHNQLSLRGAVGAALSLASTSGNTVWSQLRTAYDRASPIVRELAPKCRNLTMVLEGCNDGTLRIGQLEGAATLLAQLSESLPSESFAAFRSLVRLKTIEAFEATWDDMKDDNGKLHLFQISFAEITNVFPADAKFEEIETSVASALASTKTTEREDALSTAIAQLNGSAADSAHCQATIKAANAFGGLKCGVPLQAIVNSCMLALVLEGESVMDNAQLHENVSSLLVALFHLSPSQDLASRMENVNAMQALSRAFANVKEHIPGEGCKMIMPNNDIRPEMHLMGHCLEIARLKLEALALSEEHRVRYDLHILEAEAWYKDVLAHDHTIIADEFRTSMEAYSLRAGGATNGVVVIPHKDSEVSWDELCALYNNVLSKIEFKDFFEAQTRFQEAPV